MLPGYVCFSTGVSAPYGLTYTVYTDSVEVRWRHSLGLDEPSHGYYVSVQEIQTGLKLGRPEFVHVDAGARSVTMRGLKPYALYEMKVASMYIILLTVK